MYKAGGTSPLGGTDPIYLYIFWKTSLDVIEKDTLAMEDDHHECMRQSALRKAKAFTTHLRK